MMNGIWDARYIHVRMKRKSAELFSPLVQCQSQNSQIHGCETNSTPKQPAVPCQKNDCGDFRRRLSFYTHTHTHTHFPCSRSLNDEGRLLWNYFRYCFDINIMKFQNYLPSFFTFYGNPNSNLDRRWIRSDNKISKSKNRKFITIARAHTLCQLHTE